MAMSTQRLIIMLLSFNLVMGFIADVYNTEGTYDPTRLNTELSIGEEFTDDSKNPTILSELVDRINTGASTWGNAIWMSYTLGKYLLKGLTLPFTEFTSDGTVIETVMINIFRFLLLIFNVLGGLELYLLTKSNKAT